MASGTASWRSVQGGAAHFVEGLRPGGHSRQAITVSFRSAPEILAFVNDVFGAIVSTEATGGRRDAFRYGEDDRFPVPQLAATEVSPDSPVSFIAAEGVTETAARVADEIVRLLSGTVVRDRATGLRRHARP